MIPLATPSLRTVCAIGAVVLVSLGTAAVVFAILGHNPITIGTAAWDGVFGSIRSLAKSLEDAGPLLLCGLAVSIAMRAGVLNIGGEGQYAVGAVAGVACATTLRWEALPASMTIILSLFAGAAAGACWAGIAAVFIRYRKVNDVLVTILLNFLALSLVSWLVEGWLRDPQTSAPQTAQLARDVRLPLLMPLTRFHLGLPCVLIAAALVWTAERRTRWGFEAGVMGLQPEAAVAMGIPVASRRMSILFLSGGFAGLAGAMQIAGVTYFMSGNSHSFGYLGVAVALLGGLHPLGVVAAAVFFSLLDSGARSVEFLSVPRDVADILKGVIILSALIGAAWLANARRQNTGAR